jgi:hypothetical protein
MKHTLQSTAQPSSHSTSASPVTRTHTMSNSGPSPNPHEFPATSPSVPVSPLHQPSLGHYGSEAIFLRNKARVQTTLQGNSQFITSNFRSLVSQSHDDLQHLSLPPPIYGPIPLLNYEHPDWFLPAILSVLNSTEPTKQLPLMASSSITRQQPPKGYKCPPRFSSSSRQRISPPQHPCPTIVPSPELGHVGTNTHRRSTLNSHKVSTR